MRNLVPVLALLSLAGCATMASGRKQSITITTTPPGAACIVDELGAPPGEHVDVVTYTPGAVTVERGKKKLKITCALQGYPTTQVIQSYGVNPTAGLNVMNGVIVGTLVDNASGSLYRYPAEVHVDLVHHEPPPAPAHPASAGRTPLTPVTPTPLAPLPPQKPAPAHS